VSLQQQDLPLKINIRLNAGKEIKKYEANRFLNMFPGTEKF